MIFFFFVLIRLLLYITDSDGNLKKEIDNENTDLDKTKYFYKTPEESECYRQISFPYYWLIPYIIDTLSNWAGIFLINNKILRTTSKLNTWSLVRRNNILRVNNEGMLNLRRAMESWMHVGVC